MGGGFSLRASSECIPSQRLSRAEQVEQRAQLSCFSCKQALHPRLSNPKNEQKALPSASLPHCDLRLATWKKATRKGSGVEATKSLLSFSAQHSPQDGATLRLAQLTLNSHPHRSPFTWTDLECAWACRNEVGPVLPLQEPVIQFVSRLPTMREYLCEV